MVRHGQRLHALLHTLGASAFLRIEMVLTSLTDNQFAFLGDTYALGI